MLLAAVTLVACGGGDTPLFGDDEAGGAATYSFTIPVGAGLALDAGEPLEILPAEMTVRVGESIKIINEDDRGHLVGPFFVGAGETLTQRFTGTGEFIGACTVHPSGQLVLTVVE